MNCNELHKDIEAIKSSRSILRERYNHMNKTGVSGKTDFVESRIATEKLADEILEKYLSDFAEKNPELFNWRPSHEIKLKEKAVFSININNNNGKIIVGQPGSITEVSTTKNGQYEVSTFDTYKEWDIIPMPQINVLTMFSTNKMILGDGYKKEISVCEKDAIEKWNLVKTIKRLNNEEGENCSPHTAIELPNERILIGGDKGMLNICGRDLFGRWKILEVIPGLRDEDGRLSSVKCFYSLSNDDVLIGGSRIIYRCSKNKNTGKWELSNERKTFFNDDKDHYVEDIKTMPNGNILICTDKTIYEGKYNNENNFEQIGVYGEEFYYYGIEDGQRGEYFRKVLPISNDSIIVLSKNTAYDTTSLHELKKDDNGKWFIAQKIGYFDREKDENGNIIAENEVEDIVESANGSFIMAKRGALVEYIRRPGSVEELKDNLDKIIEQGET